MRTVGCEIVAGKVKLLNSQSAVHPHSVSKVKSVDFEHFHALPFHLNQVRFTFYENLVG
jgi:hypothetical protein